MKRNEKLLVYGVTGFLAVIVLVAILFGEGPGVESRERAENPSEGSPSAGQPGGAPERLSLDDLLDGSKAEPGDTDSKAEGDQSTDPQAGTAGALGPDSYSLNAAGATAAMRVEQIIGASQLEHGYRRVTIRRGDGLSNLVYRWCPGVDDAMELVRVLNEDLVGENPALRAGDTLLVPLVGAEDLLAAWESRDNSFGAPLPASMNAGSTPAAPAAGGSLMTNAPVPEATNSAPAGPAETEVSAAPSTPKTYKVVAGDNAWKIGKKLGLPNSKIPAFIEDLKKANPNVEDIGALSLNQTLNLPQ